MLAFENREENRKPMSPSDQDQWKRAAAEAAARIVERGMVVGLGSGSTAALFLEALGRRVAHENLRIVGIPTSERAARQAERLRIPLATLADHAQIDLTVDGADEVEPGTLNLIKGHGGAALREKIVASSSRRLAIVADETKIVEHVGALVSVPVEVVQFGWQTTSGRLKQIGTRPALRAGRDGAPFLTDGGNYILDCPFGAMKNPAEIALRLDQTVGVVEHGLFLGMAAQAFIGGRDGVKILKRMAEAGVR